MYQVWINFEFLLLLLLHGHSYIKLNQNNCTQVMKDNNGKIQVKCEAKTSDVILDCYVK